MCGNLLNVIPATIQDKWTWLGPVWPDGWVPVLTCNFSYKPIFRTSLVVLWHVCRKIKMSSLKWTSASFSLCGCPVDVEHFIMYKNITRLLKMDVSLLATWLLFFSLTINHQIQFLVFIFEIHLQKQNSGLLPPKNPMFEINCILSCSKRSRFF